MNNKNGYTTRQYEVILTFGVDRLRPSTFHRFGHNFTPSAENY